MDHIRDRLTATGSRTETTEEPTDDESSDAVEWRDISVKTNGPTGWASDTDPEKRGHATSTDSFETLDTDQLIAGVLAGINSPAFVVDCVGRIVSINTAACEAFGTAESAALGTRPPAVHSGQPRCAQVLLTGDEIRNQPETVVIDGEKRTLNRTVTPLENDSGAIVGAVETLDEVSTQSRDTDSYE